MKYLLIFFLIIFNITYLTDSFLLDACLTFTNTEDPTDNFCWSHSYASAIENKKHRKSCLKCQVNDIHALVKNVCGRTLQCISFIFYNNSFFEQFFRKYPNIIDHLLKDPKKENISNSLIITFQNYDLTEITFNYLNSILNMSSPAYQILHVIFIKPISDQRLIQVHNDFLHIPLNIIFLSFSCFHHMDDEQRIEYVIRSPGMNPKKISSCPSTQFKSTVTKNM
jgi:hypothetical protein